MVSPGGCLPASIASTISGASSVTQIKTDQRNMGRFLGGARPFGFEVVNGELVPNEAEQQAIGKMLAMRAEGQSFRSIAAAVQSEGFNVSHVAVARILKEAEP
jgi:putative DNA-invertase from lambdoid prophage Rac